MADIMLAPRLFLRLLLGIQSLVVPVTMFGQIWMTSHILVIHVCHLSRFLYIYSGRTNRHAINLLA